MTNDEFERERRKQKRLEQLGSDDPHCGMCGHSDWQALELHHVAGQKYDESTVPLCRNCHRIVSDDQYDHPAFDPDTDAMLVNIGHFMLGLADMLRRIVAKLNDFGLALIGRASIDKGEAA